MNYTPPTPTGEPACPLTLEQFNSLGQCALASSGGPDIVALFICALLLVLAGVVAWAVHNATRGRRRDTWIAVCPHCAFQHAGSDRLEVHLALDRHMHALHNASAS